MKALRRLAALGVAATLAMTAGAADLTKIERGLGKEPRYRSTAPKYCLLVFGPEAKTRTWLVLDGDRLFIDRNGNGDLTEESECIEKKPTRYDGNITVDFAIGDVVGAAGKTICRGVAIHEIIEEDEPLIFVFARYSGREFYTGRDAFGRLRFGDTPRAAPIVHIGGPLCMGLATRNRSAPVQFVRGEVTELCASVGTPGLGRGTFLGLRYPHVPEGKHPVATIEFPHNRPEGRPITIRHALKERC